MNNILLLSLLSWLLFLILLYTAGSIIVNFKTKIINVWTNYKKDSKNFLATCC